MDIVHHLYHKAQSRREFFRSLEQSGLKLLYKKERCIGFCDAENRRFHFDKIGITEASLEHLDFKLERKLLRVQERLSQLEHQHKNQRIEQQLTKGLKIKQPKR